MMNRLAIACLAVLFTCGTAFAQGKKGSEAPEGLCDATYGFDLGPTITAQPNGNFQTVAHDCTATADCNDYFQITCPAGGTLDLSFCQGGGSATFDTVLNTWSGPPNFTTPVGCNDDSCGLSSELLGNVLPVGGTFRARVGGFFGGSGSYVLAYRAPAGCTILGASPVDLIEFDIK